MGEKRAEKPLRDVVAAGVRVLFCGINPSLTSATRRHHFARPGNRFWPTIHRAGFTPRQLSPEEDWLLPEFGLGITNLVDRPTRTAAELRPGELRAGARKLRLLAVEHLPVVVAVLGATAWRAAFAAPGAQIGLQEERIAGAALWVLPNPSGLNAHYQVPELARLYGQVREFAFGG